MLDKTNRIDKSYQTVKFVCCNIFNVDNEHFEVEH